MSNSKTDFAFDELRAFLEDAYPIGKITAIESIACDEEELLKAFGTVQENSISNEEISFGSNFRVSTGQGEYFLKRISDWIGEERATAIEEFIRWTGERNFALSPAIRVSKSAQTHIKVNGNCFQLFDFIVQEKRQFWMRSQLSAEDCSLAGDLLARTHLASLEYLEQDPVRNDCFSISWDSQASFETLFQRIKSEEVSSNPALSSVVHNELLLKSRISQAMARASNSSKLAYPLLVHGDFHPGNVLFFESETGTRSAKLVDFDYLRKEHPFYDLGYGLIMFARSRTRKISKSSEQNPDQGLDWELAKAYLSGYLKALHKNPAENDESKIRKAQVEGSCFLSKLPTYVTLACFLILDWAVEKVINGPERFSEFYVDVIESLVSLVSYDGEQAVQSVWFEVMAGMN